MSFLQSSEPAALGTIKHDSLDIVIDWRRVPFETVATEVKSAVRELLGIQPNNSQKITFDKYDSRARELFAQIQSFDSTGKQAANFLSVFSGVVHEVRHAHDLMSTTFGQELIFLLMNCYQNVPQILDSLALWLDEAPARIVPLPIRGNEEQLVDFPAEAAGIFDKFWESCDRIRSDQEAPQYTHSHYTPIHLLELISINVQLGFVWELFGPKAMAQLQEVIEQSPKARLYLQSRIEVQDVFLSRGFDGQRLSLIMNYLAWCSLNRTTRVGGRLADSLNPVVMFEALVDRVSRECQDADFVSCQKSVEAFCRDWDVAKPFEVIQRYLALLRQRYSSRPPIPKKARFGMTGKVLGCWAALIKSYEYLTNFALNKGELFFQPTVYGWSFVTGQLPSVVIEERDGPDEIFRYETFGKTFISKEKWFSLSLASTILRLLSDGRGTTGDNVLEDFIFAKLREGWPTGTSFRFRDESSLFEF